MGEIEALLPTRNDEVDATFFHNPRNVLKEAQGFTRRRRHDVGCDNGLRMQGRRKLVRIGRVNPSARRVERPRDCN